MEVLEAIRTRRSFRQYKPDPVDEKTLQIVLEAARWAPSWTNSQCWRFVVVRDNQIKANLAETLPPTNRAADAIRQAPVAIVACAELGKSGFRRTQPPSDNAQPATDKAQPVTDKGDWFMFDVALAMQNLVLAAHSLGLGTVHVGLFDAPKAASVLQVPEGFCVVEMTPLGYPDGEPRPTSRKELNEIVFNDRFGNQTSGEN